MSDHLRFHDSQYAAVTAPESAGTGRLQPLPHPSARPATRSHPRRALTQAPLAPVFVGALVILWATINLALGWVGFALIVPVGFRGSGEAAISLARLFAAGTLLLMVADSESRRLRWVAGGFAVLGFGQLLFGYLEPVLDSATDVNASLTQMILVRTLGAVLIVVGLLPSPPPHLTRGGTVAAWLLCGAIFASYWLLDAVGWVPELVHVASMNEAARTRVAPMSWLSGWHWILAAIPLGLAIVAAAGASHQQARGHFGAWLPVSIVLLAGSEVHDALWPSAYGTTILFTSADFLRLAMAAVVVAGGTMELRRIAAYRASLLASEREHAQRLEELASLKQDLTAMIAHELGHPLSGIRRLTELLTREGLDDTMRQQALASLLQETNTLDHLVTDVQDTAAFETGFLPLRIQPVTIETLLDDARSAAGVARREPPVELSLRGVTLAHRVEADRHRIGQVIRNLAGNAEKFAPHGTTIVIEVREDGPDRVEFAVIDQGPGIAPADAGRIFEKFGRGREALNRQIAGAGIGLYISRQIVRSHGSDLTVRSRSGGGAIFAFHLRLAATGTHLP